MGAGGEFGTKATLSEVGSDATVSLIFSPDEGASSNKTIATGLTDASGVFTINPGFSPVDNKVYVLEAIKRIGAAGNAVMTVRTYIKWNATPGNWTSITTPTLAINTKTTAITIIDSYDNTITSSDTIGKVDITGGSSVVSPIGSVTTQTITDVANMVTVNLGQNVDPTRFIKYQSGKYFLSKEPNHNKSTVISTKNCVDCDLSSEDLSNQDLSTGNLSRADLSWANLNNSNLNNANLSSSNVTGTTFTGTTLTGVNFTDVNLSSKNLSSLNLSGSNFTNANLTSANLSSANISNSNLTGTTFTGATLTGTNFSNVDLTNRSFNSFNLNNANFTGATLTGVTFTGATLTGVNFSNVDLTNKNFNSLNLSNANFTGATLTGVTFTGATLNGTNFTGQDLTGRNFSSLNLSGGNFTNANLTNGNFSNSNLNGANFTNTTLTGANFEGSIWTNGSNCSVGSIGMCIAPPGEQRVNTYTLNTQRNPDIAINNSNGDFVVTWESFGQDGSNYGIYAQRYNSNLEPQGLEFKVNSYTTSNQQRPSVAVNSSGNFIISWDGEGNSDTQGIFAQKYNSSGSENGVEFKANSYTSNPQSNSIVSIDSLGYFNIHWAGYGANTQGIYRQFYNIDGSVNGSETFLHVFPYGSADNQNFPDVAMNDSGKFVVCWEEGSTQIGISAQNFSSQWVPESMNYEVSPYGGLSGTKTKPTLSIDNNGNYVIVWVSQSQDSFSNNGVYAQRYNSSGVIQGSEFRVNTYTTSHQQNPSIAVNRANGDFVVVWESQNQDGSGYGIYGQRYNISGVAQGSEFKVNTYTTNTQQNPAVAINSSNGDFIVVWEGQGATDTSGIYMKRYNSSGVEY